MLKLTIPKRRLLNEKTNEIYTVKEQTIVLEHSLVSISKWESTWCKPFLSSEKKSLEEIRDYVRCMTLTQNVDPLTYFCLTADNFDEINKYINTEQTATTFRKEEQAHKKEIITSELMYFWMINYGIPFECAKWHLSRLIALVRICQIKMQPSKQMGKNAILNQNAKLNAQRRSLLHTKG